MEIRTVAFESELIITLENNQKVVIAPFKTHEPVHFKLGIDAPKNVSINGQETLRKQEQLKKEKASSDS